MKLISPAMLAAEAARRWREHYYSEESGCLRCIRSRSEASHKRLVALGPTPTPEQVNEVIGNDSWTETRCDECGSYGVPIVELGEPPDYESSTARVCLGCLREAVGLVEALTP